MCIYSVAFETITVPSKLIQLLFTTETNGRSEHSSPVTRRPDLVCSRVNVRFGILAAIQMVNSYLKSRLHHSCWNQKAEGAQGICERQWMKHRSLKHVSNRRFPQLWSGSAYKEQNKLPNYFAVIQGDTEFGLTHHCQVNVPVPKNTVVGFWVKVGYRFFSGSFGGLSFFLGGVGGWGGGVESGLELFWFCFFFLHSFSEFGSWLPQSDFKPASHLGQTWNFSVQLLPPGRYLWKSITRKQT